MADQKNQNQGSQQPQTGNRNPQGQQSGQTGSSSTDYKTREEGKKTGNDQGDRDLERKGMRNDEVGSVEDRELKTPRAEEEEESNDEATGRTDRSRQGGSQNDNRR